MISTRQPGQPERVIREVSTPRLPRFDSFLVEDTNIPSVPWQRFFQFLWQRVGGSRLSQQQSAFLAQDAPTGRAAGSPYISGLYVHDTITGNMIGYIKCDPIPPGSTE
jgi:hypothetical protein